MRVLLLLLIAVALAGTQLLLAGVKIAYALPGYLVLGALACAVGFVPSCAPIRKDVRHALVVACIFAGYVALRAVASPYVFLTRLDLLMMLASGVIYLIFSIHLTSPGWRTAFVGIVILLAAVNCAVGARQFLTGDNFMLVPGLLRHDYGNRASGLYHCPNHLAGFLEVTLFFCLAFALWSEWKVVWRSLAGYMALVCVAGLLVTGSRGGYVSTIIAAAIFAVISFRLVAQRFVLHPFVLWLLAAVALVGVSAAVVTVVRKTELLHFRVESSAVGSTVRAQLSRAAIKQFQLQPLVGTGSGTYLFYGRRFREPTMQLETNWAHNDVFQFMAEYGAIGLACLLAMVGIHFRNGWRSISGAVSGIGGGWLNGSNSLALTLGALCGTTAIAVHSFVDFNLHMPANTLLMGFVFALLASPGDPVSRDMLIEEKPIAVPVWCRVVLPAIGLWLIAAGAPRLKSEYLGERARQILSDGTALDSLEKLRAAESYAREASDADPRNPTLLYYLGEAKVMSALLVEDDATRERLYRESIDAYSRAKAITPEDGFLDSFIAGSYAALGESAKAEQSHRDALALDPNNASLHWSYAAFLHAQKRFDDAEREYIRALDLKIGLTGHQALDRLKADRAAAEASAEPPKLRP